MAQPAAMNAICQCPFGAAPCPLMVSSQSTVLSGALPLATILDRALPSFGTCVSPLNPAVAAILSSTGVLAPQPCAPVIVAPWAPGCPTVLVGGKPLLNASSKLLCAYGGAIGLTSTILNVTTP